MVELKLFHLPFALLLCLPIYVVFSSSGSYSGYFDLTSQVLAAVVLLFMLCLPLVFVGFLRKGGLDVWTMFVVCACFNFSVMPFLALNWFDRWMSLLVYPFTFSAAIAVPLVFQSTNRVVRQSVDWLKVTSVPKKTSVTLLSCMVLLTSLCLGATLQSNNYVVTSMPTASQYYSVAPTVPVQDVEGTEQVIQWLDKNMDSGSCVLVPSAFSDWARLHLDGEHTLVVFSSDAKGAFDTATSQGHDPVYLVWWGENIAWHWFTVPSSFQMVFQSGRMAAFQIPSGT